MANKFYNDMFAALLNAAQKQGAPHPETLARLGTAQSFLETGGGRHAPGNNYFGIKGKSGGGKSYSTNEVVGGRTINIKDSFRGYPSMQDSANDYVKLVGSKPRYAGVYNAKTPEEAISAQARSGYATDPQYGAKLTSIHSRNSGPMPDNLPAWAQQQIAQTQAPTPPRRPDGLTPAPTQLAQAAPPKGSVLNDINPKDPSGPLLSADGKPPAQLASIGKNDFAGGVPTSGMQAPSMNPQLQQPEPQLAQAPLPPSRPEGLDAPPMQLADAPMPPSRPAMPTSNPSAPVPVEVAFNRPAPSTPRMPSMASNEPTLHAPMGGGGGGVEGMAADMGGQPQMGGDMGGEFSLAGLFGDAMGPQQQDPFMSPFMTADAGFGGGFDAGGGFGDLGSLFGGLFA